MLAQADNLACATRIVILAKWNYSIMERECLAVIWALNKPPCYYNVLLVKVNTDFSTKTKLTRGKGLSTSIIRPGLKLVKYKVDSEHRA